MLRPPLWTWGALKEKVGFFGSTRRLEVSTNGTGQYCGISVLLRMVWVLAVALLSILGGVSTLFDLARITNNTCQAVG